jgi:hypothetical protein
MSVSPPASAQPKLLDRFAWLIRQYPLAVSTAAALALTLVSVTAFTPRYETNDDVTMQLIASGLVFTDRPDEHILFSNVLIGRALTALYTDVPSVPWYALYQLITLSISAAAIGYALLRVNPAPRQAAAFGFFLVVAMLPCLIQIQFTKTAFLAAFAGLLLLLAPLRGATPWPRLAEVTGCVLIAWGSLIRYESFMLAGLVALPVAAVAAFAEPKRAARQAVPLALAVAAAIGLQQYNRTYYARDEEWRDFYQYNAIRAEFTDYARYPYTPETRRAFADAGWSEPDYWMMRNWFFADKDRYSLQRLQQIAATVPASTTASLGGSFKDLLSNLPRFPDLIRIMLAMPVIAILTGRGPWRFIFPAVLFALAFACTVILATYLWVPVRVAVPLFGGVLAAAALRPGGAAEAGRSSTTEVDRVLYILAGLLSGGLCLWTFADYARRETPERRFHADMERVVSLLKPRHDQLYVLWREWFPLENLVFPFQDVRGLRDFRCVSLSTLLPTPFTDRRLHEFDIHNLDTAIYERPDVTLIAMNKLVELYHGYVVQHYGVKLKLGTIFSADAARSMFVGVDNPPHFLVCKLIDGSKLPPEQGGAPQRPKTETGQDR